MEAARNAASTLLLLTRVDHGGVAVTHRPAISAVGRAERADAALYAWIESDRIQAARWRGRLIVSEEAVDAFLAIKPRKHVVTNTATAEANND